MNKEHSTRKSPKRDYSIYFKTGFITIFTLLLMIPTAFVTDLIHEREGYQYKVKNEISSSWGAKQTVSGPLLAIPYQLEHINADQKTYLTDHTFYLTPAALNMDLDLDTEIRKKSIYEAILYTSAIKIQGSFNLSKIKDESVANIDFSKAHFILGIKNPTSISKKVDLKWDDEAIEVNPGTGHSEVVSRGLKANVSVKGKDEVTFDLKITLKGSEQFYFEPTAKNTTINMQSDWPSPGFVGNILADQRKITESGFNATWNISEFNRTVPDYWSDTQNRLQISGNTFGVDLINPVDHYQKNMRSAKYALLIISLTFTAFFFFEIMYKKKVHPIQYGLIGIALVLFYYLLLSITEHLGFSWAYIIASLGTILLITLYSASLLKSRKSTMILFTILTILYTYIFVLLQLEEFALIAGSIGLFFILSGIMYLSRKVNWYHLSSSEKQVEADNIVF